MCADFWNDSNVDESVFETEKMVEESKNNSRYSDRDGMLVAHALRGDQLAYAELMNCYWDTLCVFLSRRLKSKEDVEDIAMAVFGKAFRRLDTYKDSYAFSTWLIRIAENAFIDFMRKNEHSTVSIDEDREENTLGLSIPCNRLGPEDRLIQKQRIKEVLQVIEGLKPHYRSLIELRYLKEYSYDEIAKELDMPIGSVKAKLFRARDLILQTVKQSDPSF